MTNIIDSLGLSPVAILFYAINLVLVFVAVRFLLFKPVKKIIDKRKESMEAVFAENEKLNKEISEQKAKFQQTLEDTKQEVARLTLQAEANIKAKETEMLAAAHTQAKVIVDNAAKDMEMEKKRLLNEYKEKLPGLSVGIASKILGREVVGKDNDTIISQALDNWGKD